MNVEQFTEFGWNVIDDSEFKKRFCFVFDRVARVLAKSLGPYGKTTVIEKHGTFHITKDGWHILKNIKMSDPINNNIMQMIYDIAAIVAIKVGDGTTTSIVAADAMLKNFNSNEALKKLRPREFENVLNDCINEIEKRLLENASEIDKSPEATFEDIYKIAKISTNDNVEIANMIQQIYVETRNPSIDFLTSKTNKTSFEIISGYKLPYMTYLDKVFVNNDDGICVVDNPLIFMADFKCELSDRFKKLLAYLEMMGKEEGRKVVVFFPYYDKYALDFLKRKIMQEYSAYGTIPMVFGRVSLTNNMDDTLYNDFSIMAGGTIIKDTAITEEMTDEDFLVLVGEGVGRVDKITIGADSSTIFGFSHRKEHMYTATLQDAKDSYTQLMTRDIKTNIVTTDTFNMKRRVSRLTGKMGVIHIGGPSELAKEANKDLIEDAVKACDSAFSYGYNIGSGFATIKAIGRIIEEPNVSEAHALIYQLLFETFLDVFKVILTHKYPAMDESWINDKIKCILTNIVESDNGLGYDIVTEEFSDAIINPCYTDIEVLKAASSLIGMIVSSNQYISITVREPANGG